MHTLTNEDAVTLFTTVGIGVSILGVTQVRSGLKAMLDESREREAERAAAERRRAAGLTSVGVQLTSRFNVAAADDNGFDPIEAPTVQDSLSNTNEALTAIYGYVNATRGALRKVESRTAALDADFKRADAGWYLVVAGLILTLFGAVIGGVG